LRKEAIQLIFNGDSMLKIILNKIKNYGTFLGGPDDSGPTLHTWTETVVDETATANAIGTCQRGAQSKIDALNDTITECDEHLQAIDEMEAEITEKIGTADTVMSNYSSVQSIVDTSNLNININTGCQDCLNNVKTTLNNMLTECTTKREEWQTKKDQAELDLESAEADYAACSDIVKYKDVVKSGWW